MDGGQRKDTKDLSEESNRQETVNIETGTGRFYRCTFCKHGFSNAQALGGHMNIHRRDRARIREQSLPSIANDPANLNLGSVAQQMPNHPSIHSTNYNHMYLLASTSSTRRTQMFHADNSPPQQPSLFGEELNFGSSAQVKDREEEKKDGEDGELDLELRLGPEP